MSSEPIAIDAKNVSKFYQIYKTPSDRLKQFILPKFASIVGRQKLSYYKEFWALNDISFTIPKGQTVGIIGRNGAGKSTLLQILCGTLTPSGGQVQVSGRVAALLELGSGFNPEFTGRENVILNASVLGLAPKDIDARFDAIAAFADIGDFLDQPVKTYSSGMMVRLAFAVIAHVDADILIIDEALAVGDAFFTQKCMRFLRAFMQEGTVLFVSHDTASIRSLCNRAIWLEHGKVVQDGHPKEVCDAYLQAFYEDFQGKSDTAKSKNSVNAIKKSVAADPRMEMLNHSKLRNDLYIPPFDFNAHGFGLGGASITNVCFVNEQGEPLNWILGGENVCLEVSVQCGTPLTTPIIGFMIKDKLGQSLFGDNTALSYMDHPVSCAMGDILVGKFEFQMPRLSTGDYSITVAIADGTQQDHVQHHWVHDALMFKSESTSVASGLIGVPMSQITLSATR